MQKYNFIKPKFILIHSHAKINVSVAYLMSFAHLTLLNQKLFLYIPMQKYNLIKYKI